MTTSPVNPALLLVAEGQTRNFLVNFLEGHEQVPRVVGNLGEALLALKGQQHATVFVDCQAVSTYGPGLYAKMKVACPHCRVILLCDKTHQKHRDLVKEAMELGIYACLLAPFAEWEVLAMIRQSQGTSPKGRRPLRNRARH